MLNRWACLLGMSGLSVGVQGETGSETAGANVLLDAVAKELSDQAKAMEGKVSLNYYYKTNCNNCLAHIQGGLLPLIWANLPGDKVQLKLLPWVPSVTSEFDCLGDFACSFARDHMCAIASTFQNFARIDDPAVQNAAQFVACDLRNGVGGASPDENAAALPDCAQSSSLPWDGPFGLKTCTRGSDGFELLKAPAYTTVVEAAQRELKKTPHQMLPFVFINGEQLVCEGPQYCTGLRSATGVKKLEKPGTLLRVVCQLLDPVPEACEAVLEHDPNAVKPAVPAVAGGTGACESCVEVGSFHWDYHGSVHRSQAPLSTSLAVLCFAALLAVASIGLVVAFRTHRRRWMQEDQSAVGQQQILLDDDETDGRADSPSSDCVIE